MDKYWVTGWLILNEEQRQRLINEVKKLPNSIKDYWLIQDRLDSDVFQPSFAHFGSFMSADDQKKFLKEIIRYAKSIYSTYDEPDEYTEGKFFISDSRRAEPELQVNLVHGSYSINEAERERPRDL